MATDQQRTSDSKESEQPETASAGRSETSADAPRVGSGEEEREGRDEASAGSSGQGPDSDPMDPQDVENEAEDDPETEADQQDERGDESENVAQDDTGQQNETSGGPEAGGDGSPTPADRNPDLLEHVLKWLGHESVPPGLVSILHSVIFAADKPLTLANIKKVLDDPDTKVLRAALRALQDIHHQMGVQLVEVAGGYRFRTNPEHARWVKKLVPEKPIRLSRAALEVLAVVAYRQPVTRAEVEDIRGVDCGGVLRSLLERSLVKIVGRKPEPGRPLLYGTTKEFLSFFGLKSLRDLPSLRDIDALEEERGTAQDAKADETVDSVLADGLADLIAEQADATIEEDPVLEKALEEAHEAAKKANKTFRTIKKREQAFQPEQPEDDAQEGQQPPSETS